MTSTSLTQVALIFARSLWHSVSLATPWSDHSRPIYHSKAQPRELGFEVCDGRLLLINFMILIKQVFNPTIIYGTLFV